MTNVLHIIKKVSKFASSIGERQKVDSSNG